MKPIGRQTTARSSRWGVAATLVLALGVGACDSLLEVELPGVVTDLDVDNPAAAPILLNAIMGLFECGYSTFTMDAAGQEDNFQMVTGVAGNYSQYTPTPGYGGCDEGNAYDQDWAGPFTIARAQGYSTYQSMLGWGSSAELRATTAFYTAAILDIFGEHFCEFAVDSGPLLTPTATLNLAEGWADTVFAITAASGDFDISTQAGEHTSSINTATYGLRARIRWARGDLALAAADAAMVPDGHVSWVLREAGEGRRNMPSTSQSGGGGVQAAGFLQGPVKLKDATNTYGITVLGSHPNGTAWPNPLPFTGYINLGIETATGRAVDAAGYPVLDSTSTEFGPSVTKVAGTEDDTRVTHIKGNTAGGVLDIPQKYPNDADDIPLINWKEMRLIRAEAAGNTQAGIDHVNAIRTADGLPGIGTGADTSYRDALLADADAYEDMLIEETRRALWQEARFWSRKIVHNEKLWFPRAEGDLINAGASYT
ncbi:MAG: hypothetical protein OEN00_12345, partial [Gemmatimonadota bacterium]|nr:hypothetical protein [Gemmatimonadota bacterium]